MVEGVRDQLTHAQRHGIERLTALGLRELIPDERPRDARSLRGCREREVRFVSFDHIFRATS